MSVEQYLAFLVVSLVVICTPGQDTALTIRNTLLGGRPAGVATSAGVVAGQLTWTLATSAGLAVILVASGQLFTAIRLAGAAYLVYLGGRSLFSAITGACGSPGEPRDTTRGLRPAAGFWQGFLSNLSNAKMAVFFISLLPQFAGPHPGFVILAVLGLNFGVLTLAWLTGYAVAVERMRRLLSRASIRRAMDAVLGAVLVGLGLRLSAEVVSSGV